MGVCNSYDNIYERDNQQLKKYKKQFEALQLRHREIGRLHKIYNRVDADGSGSIELIELLVHIDIERTKFTERCFSIFDEDKSGQIDFREFVLSLWNYCTLGRASLTLFAFDLYDADSSGILSVHEINGMMKDIYGGRPDKNPFAREIAKELLKLESRGDFDIDMFKGFVKTHQALLFPAFQMQDSLRKKILGVSFWEKQANRRIELSHGKYVPVAEFLQIHLDKNLYQHLVSSPIASVKPMKGNAKLALQVTGSHSLRNQSAEDDFMEQFANSPDHQMIGKKKFVMRKSAEEVMFNEATRDMGETYSAIQNSSATKMITSPAGSERDGVSSGGMKSSSGSYRKGSVSVKGSRKQSSAKIVPVQDGTFSAAYSSKEGGTVGAAGAGAGAGAAGGTVAQGGDGSASPHPNKSHQMNGSTSKRLRSPSLDAIEETKTHNLHNQTNRSNAGSVGASNASGNHSSNTSSRRHRGELHLMDMPDDGNPSVSLPQFSTKTVKEIYSPNKGASSSSRRNSSKRRQSVS